MPIDRTIGMPIIGVMNTRNAIKELVGNLGGQVSTADALKVKQPTVSGWITGRHGMSPIVAMRAERLTGIPASDLCPELNEVPAA